MKSKLFCCVVFLFFPSIALARQSSGLNAAEIKLALGKLSKICSVLYVAAHPDDENTAVLAYAANEMQCRTAYLSLTRGEGGQNLLGAEKGATLGVIRTQELLAARRIDGAEQFFTRAVDFGFSKTAKETLEKWNKQEVLFDIVWTIRQFRPDVVITRFPPDARAGHGHHQASAILAAEAFRLAADARAFPEQLKYVSVWQPKRLVWNAFFRQDEKPPPDAVSFDVGKFNRLLGKSYTEIAAESRTMHKSQGQGTAAARGAKIEYFTHVDGEKAQTNLLDGIETSWRKYGETNLEEEILQKSTLKILGKSYRNLSLYVNVLSPVFQNERILAAIKQMRRMEKYQN
jgi:LmbE family N-acetylglucosaminyl deacetylase